MAYTPPEGFTLDPNSGKYYRSDIVADVYGAQTQWVTWFDANSGQYEQVSYPLPAPEPVQQMPMQNQYFYPEPASTPLTEAVNEKSGRKLNALLAAIPVITLLIGLGIAFFQLDGLAFFRSNDAEVEEFELINIENMPALVLSSHHGNFIEQQELEMEEELDDTLEYSDDVEEIIEPEPEEKSGPININMDLISLLGQTNRDLMNINGDIYAYIYLFGGGMPAVEYTGYEARYPLVFYFAGNEDEMWRTIEYRWGLEEGGEAGLGNFWPDDYKIVGMEVWDGVYDPNWQYLFEGQEKVPSLDLLTASFQHGEVQHFPMAEQQHDSYEMDVWTCTFYFENFAITGTFYDSEGTKILLFARVWMT